MPTAFVRQLPEQHRGPLVKLGDGEVGGKARGLGFLSAQLELFDVNPGYSPHRILVPETTVIATDEFDRFVEDNGLREMAGRDDKEILAAFLATPLAPEVEATLRRYALTHRCPIAVRSSSRSEDAVEHAFAGVYLTYMLPNSSPVIEDRVRQLAQALRLVWAHVYCSHPIAYMRAHGIDPDEEKMAVILQEVVGSAHESEYYPLCSGVAQSYNFFPIGGQRAEDGAASIVFGLGKRAVDDDDALRFDLARPTVRPQAHRPIDFVRASQTQFYCVDLDSGARNLTGDDMDTLNLLPIDAAELHGTLDDLASTWVPEENVLYEGTFREGQRVIAFQRILRGELFPLPALLSRLLKILADGFGRPVEIEFALTIDSDSAERVGTFHLLQARPMGSVSTSEYEAEPTISPSRVILRSKHAMGNDRLSDIRHVVYLPPTVYDPASTHEAARDIASINEELLEAGESYLLLVPGRLGSRNSALGIPLTFPQIAGAAALIELSTTEYMMEPSQGTHFFHNMVSRGMPYIAVETQGGDFFNLSWFASQPCEQRGLISYIQPDPPLEIRVFGTKQEGVVFQGGDDA